MKTLLLLALFATCSLFAQTSVVDSIRNLVESNPKAYNYFSGIMSFDLYKTKIGHYSFRDLNEGQISALKPSQKRKMMKHSNSLLFNFRSKKMLIRTLFEFKKSGLIKMKILVNEYTIDSSIFDLIRCYANLEELTIKCDSIVMPEHLNELSKLKKLYIYSEGRSLYVPTNLKNNIHLTHFRLETRDYISLEQKKNFDTLFPRHLRFSSTFNLPNSLVYLELREEVPRVLNLDESRPIPQVIQNLSNLQSLFLTGNYDSCFLDFTRLNQLINISIYSPSLIYWKPKQTSLRLTNLKYVNLSLGSYTECPDIIENVDTLFSFFIFCKAPKITLTQKVVYDLVISNSFLSKVDLQPELKIGILELYQIGFENVSSLISKCVVLELAINNTKMNEFLLIWPQEDLNIELYIRYESLVGIDVNLLKKLQFIKDIKLSYNHYNFSEEEINVMYKIIRK